MLLHDDPAPSYSLNSLANPLSHRVACRAMPARHFMGDQLWDWWGTDVRNKLTAVQVKNAGDGKFYDGGGLILVRKGGVGKWVYRFSHLGRRRDMGLGPQSDMTLADARKQRDQWASVLARGDDPISVRDAEKQAQRDAHNRIDPTFAEMVDTVFEAKKATLRGGGVRGRWLSPLKLYMVPKIGKKRMSQIHQSDIKAALSGVWTKKHPTATKAIQRTRIVFEQARLMGIDCDPFTVDAAKHMLGEVTHQVMHHQSTPWQDIPDLFERLGGKSVGAACLRWCILTLARSHGCRGAQFNEIDGDLWTIPADRIKGRAGKAHDFRVPLSRAAIEIVEDARQYSNTFLFPGYRSGYVSDQALTKMLRRMGETGTVHGFRTSFRTWVQDVDACGFEVAETVLGHSIGGKVERSYARSDLLDRRRIVMEKWAAFVTKAPGKVIPISAGA